MLAKQIIKDIEIECKALMCMKNETQAKGKIHENIAKNVLEKHGLRNLKETDCFKNCEDNNSKEIIKKKIKKKEHFLDVLPGFYYYYQLYGSQKPPDFVLFNIGITKTNIIKLECKSGPDIKWNDSFPSLDTFYIFTQTSKKTIYTILFTGNDDCKLAMYGPDILRINNEYENEVKQVREKNQRKFREASNTDYSIITLHTRVNRTQRNFPKPELYKLFFEASLEKFLKNDNLDNLDIHENLTSTLENLSLT